MTGSYLFYNELHYNGLMTDLGLISVNALSNADTFSDNTIFPYDTPNGVAAKASLQLLYGQTKRQDFLNGKS